MPSPKKLSTSDDYSPVEHAGIPEPDVAVKEKGAMIQGPAPQLSVGFDDNVREPLGISIDSDPVLQVPICNLIGKPYEQHVLTEIELKGMNLPETHAVHPEVEESKSTLSHQDENIPPDNNTAKVLSSPNHTTDIDELPLKSPQEEDNLEEGTRSASATGSEHGDVFIDAEVQLDLQQNGFSEGRVEISNLPVMNNPLQKAGRHTVIRGRLDDTNPFSVAVKNMGFKLVSREMENLGGAIGEEERRTCFFADLNAFLKEINSKHFKIPVIGGGELDIYALMKEVMLLGGVRNVVRKRAFRIVAQQLGIPKTCTSAASVLKGAYEKLLFHYEQRLTFGKWPENPEKAVNMKDMVCEDKEREKRARVQLHGRGKKRPDEFDQSGHSQKKKRSGMPCVASGYNMVEKVPTTGPETTEHLLSLATQNSGEEYELPLWAKIIPTTDSYLTLIEAANRLEANRGKHYLYSLFLGQ